MLFSSIVFLFAFLPIVLILYYIVPKAFKNVVMLLGSLVFYAWGEPVYIFLMLLSILFNYVCGLDISRYQVKGKKAKRRLVFNIIVNLFILGFFKYSGFVINTVNGLLPVSIPYRELSLPIGISFYTFQLLSYTIDIYRGNVKVQKNILNFALYVTMFPQLIAGPIVRYADVERQLANRRESWGKFGEGVLLFVRGLAKKVLLANTVGLVFEEVTALPSGNVSVLSAWLGCAAYTFQIYFDFSGYSDMATGLGKMFGFDFSRNFFYPYMSKSITEFWRRWHISLGSWFREYVYIPLGGNRVTVKRHICNILIVWALTGLWHGAAWNFVIWGLYYGLVLLIEKYFLQSFLSRIPSVFDRIYSMLLVMIGWVFFFSPTPGAAVGYLKVMTGIGANGLVDKYSLYLLVTNAVLWVLLILGSTPYVHQVYERVIYGGKKVRTVLNCIVYMAMFLLCVAYLVTESYNPFLYFRF